MNSILLMQQLEAQSNPSRKKVLLKAGASDKTYGVPLGYLRTLAKTIGINHELAIELWKTQNTDARLLSVMLFDPKKLSTDDIIVMIEEEPFEQIVDDLIFRALSKLDDYEAVMDKLKDATKDHLKRAYWTFMVLVIEDSNKTSPNMIEGLIKEIESKLKNESPKAQWMMNRALAEIGIKYEAYTNICLNIGEKLGIYKDLKVPAGCTSAYIPNWIHAILRKKK